LVSELLALEEKPNSLSEIKMDSSSLKENFIAALEDLDKANLENDKMKYKLKKAEDYIKRLKAQIDISRSKREELVESLKEPDNDTSNLIISLKKEKEEMKNEYETMISQLTNEIQQDKEEKKKIEEDLKNANKEIERMKLEANYAITKHQDLEKDNIIIKGELEKTKIHVEKLHESSKSIDKQLEKQKSKGDMTRIGHSKIHESKIENNQEQTSKSWNQNQEWIKTFRGRCFGCNKLGHMKKYCKNKTVPKFFLGYCFNCWRYGHKRDDCRKSNKVWRNQGYLDKKTICYRCNTIGHIARNCRSQNPNKASIKCFNCGINGHTAKYCKCRKTLRNERSSTETEGIIKKNLLEHQNKFNRIFVKEDGKNNGKVWKEKK
jgi:hypothetical protein